MEKNTYDYIIIGSGFGGSVSAMRLAEKGYSVLVLEQGKYYKDEDFPKNNWNFKKFFWAPIFKWFGIQKLTFFKEVFILSGTGVGGGSLVYANTQQEPPDAFYNHSDWSHFKNWKETLSPFYKKAKFMLGTTKNPIFGKADHILKEVAEEMGKGDTFEPVNVGVYFGDKEKETDPYFNGLGPLRKGCTECAGCMVGCRENAKNTLVKNYLHFAQKFGALISPERRVEKIEYQDGQYLVETYNSTKRGNREKITFKSKGLVVSGGVLGTLDLLFKQKNIYKSLPNLSGTLGGKLRTNSEMICGITSPGEKMNEGIAISSIFTADENTNIEVVKYPDGSDAMKLFATLATPNAHPVLRPFLFLLNVITHPLKLFKLMKKGWAKSSVILLVMQTLDNSMKMVYKKFPFKGLSIKNTSNNRVPAYIDSGQKAMYKFAKKTGGIPQNAFTEVLFNMTTTAHIMGGCPMGKTENDGVVDEYFKAHGYENMYILDGSIIPANLGVNPSLTITALSEYAMHHIAEKEGNKNISLDNQLNKEKELA